MDKILEDREKRYNEILSLINKYRLPIVCGKINYPGTNKNTEESNRAFSILVKQLKRKYGEKMICSVELNGYDGKSFLAALRMEAFEAKKMAIEIEEEHILGRVFDIDIYVDDGSSLGRESINNNPRKCIICEDNARVCIRNKKHTVEETIDKINRLIKEYGEKHEN
jgi:holo-ACP synthase